MYIQQTNSFHTPPLDFLSILFSNDDGIHIADLFLVEDYEYTSPLEIDQEYIEEDIIEDIEE